MSAYLEVKDVREIVGPFDPEARCPKCGHDGLFTRWCAPAKGCGHSCHPSAPERMLRRCERCRFDWWELPLAVDPETTPPD